MRYYLFFLIAFAILFSCNKRNCEKDCFFDLKFRYSLDVIDLSENGQDVFIEDKLDAIQFLQVATGHISQISDLEHPLYNNKFTYQEDLNKWNKWYKERRCILSDHEIDSILIAYKRLND